MSPEDFFAEVFGPPTTEWVPSPQGPSPALLDLAQSRFTSTDKGSIGRRHLEKLDALRYNDPAKALQRIEHDLEFLEPQLIPYALGIYASTCRLLVKLDEAKWALAEALEMATASNDDLVLGDLLLRASSLWNEDGKNERAIEVAEKALVVFARGDSLPGVGRSLVKQGIYLVLIEEYQMANKAFTTGRSYITPTDSRYQFSALHGAGFIQKQLGYIDEALALFEEATPFAKNSEQKGKLSWSQALIHADRRQWEKMVENFHHSIGALLECSPVDTALVVCDFVEVLLGSQRPSEAWALADTMRRLVGPLEDRSEVMAAAALDLYHSLTNAREQLPIALVKKVAEKIRRAKNTHRN